HRRLHHHHHHRRRRRLPPPLRRLHHEQGRLVCSRHFVNLRDVTAGADPGRSHSTSRTRLDRWHDGSEKVEECYEHFFAGENASHFIRLPPRSFRDHSPCQPRPRMQPNS